MKRDKKTKQNTLKIYIKEDVIQTKQTIHFTHFVILSFVLIKMFIFTIYLYIE